MVQNEFDQACRYTAKLDPVGLIAWLLRQWLDIRGVLPETYWTNGIAVEGIA